MIIVVEKLLRHPLKNRAGVSGLQFTHQVTTSTKVTGWGPPASADAINSKWFLGNFSYRFSMKLIN